MEDTAENNVQVVDIDRWASSLSKMLDDVPQYMCTPEHPGRISRVPENLREVDVKSYEPYFLSIGPYHHGKSRLQQMEKRKHVVLKCLLEQKPDITLKDYLKEIRSLEQEARSFYSDLQMEREKFLQMMLLDSLCIITAFYGMPKGQERNDLTNPMKDMTEFENHIIESDRDVIYNDNMQMIMRGDGEIEYEGRSGHNNAEEPRWFWYLFAHDLLLLENQLPLFVIQKIQEIVYGGSKTQLLANMRNSLSNLLLDYGRLDAEMVFLPTTEMHHLLHLCHLFFRPLLQQAPMTLQLAESSQMFRLGSAVQLYEAGVIFQARSDATPHSLLDITVSSSGKMIMPCLHVDDNTCSLLRNLIALEQMKYPSLGLNVSAYVVLLLHLTTTPKDVELLRRKGIIQHHLSSDKEMMYFVNRLSTGLAFDYVEDDYSLKVVFQELKRYSERRVPRWRAWMKHRYFTNPWTAVSLWAASLLLLLTALQTFYSVYSYYWPFMAGN